MSQSPQQSVSVDDAQAYLKAWVTYRRMMLSGESFSGRERHCVFLNTTGERFATVSAVSGLDFPDDGRAIAMTDWDHDGDLDLWIFNRTGPQVRFMRNDVPGGSRFLAVRLRGVTDNRDGIGARLELYLKGASDKPILRTLHAGDSYLSQSTKWVHFGLGETGEVERLVVRWPSGDVQTFAALAGDARYVVTQGEDAPAPWTPPTRDVALEAKPIDQPAHSEVAQARFTARAPMPLLNYTDLAGREQSIAAFQGRAVLVNLWATWCQPCMKELRGFAEHEQELRAAGIEVLALSVDGLGDDRGTSVDAIRGKLDELGYKFESGLASRDLLAKLELLRNELLAWHRPFPVPTSFLVDPDGRLAAIYTGPVEIEQLLDDAKLLRMTPEQLLDATMIFPGQWLRPPAEIRVDALAETFIDAGHHDDAAYMLTRFATGGRAASFAEAHNRLGQALADSGDLDAAVSHFEAAMQLDAGVETVFVAQDSLGVLRMMQGRLDEAERHFAAAIEAGRNHDDLKPRVAQSSFKLGKALSGQKRLAEAAAAYREAIALDPTLAEAHNELGIVMAQTGRLDEAITHFKKAVELAPDNQNAQDNLNKALGLLGSGG